MRGDNQLCSIGRIVEEIRQYRQQLGMKTDFHTPAHRQTGGTAGPEIAVPKRMWVTAGCAMRRHKRGAKTQCLQKGVLGLESPSSILL